MEERKPAIDEFKGLHVGDQQATRVLRKLSELRSKGLIRGTTYSLESPFSGKRVAPSGHRGLTLRKV
jgi:hypothetical protein